MVNTNAADPGPGGNPFAEFMRSLADVPLPPTRGVWNNAAHPLSGPRPVRVPISALDLSDLRERAEAHSKAIANGWTAPTYGNATPEMCEVGILGEDAVAHYLRSTTAASALSIADHPEAIRNRRGDIEVLIKMPHSAGGLALGVEVKTARVGDWKAIGRVVHPKHLHSRAAAFVWCVVADELPTTSVLLMGWARSADVRGSTDNVEVTVYGKPGIRVGAPLHAIDELADWLHDEVAAAPPF